MFGAGGLEADAAPGAAVWPVVAAGSGELALREKSKYDEIAARMNITIVVNP